MARILIIMFLLLSSLAPFSYARVGIGFGDFDYIPAPKLLSPLTNDIDLTGKQFLKFEWIRYEDPTKVDHYEFRLYRGYGMVQAGLITKQNFSYGDYPIKMPSSLFEAGQVYSWSLRIVYFTGVKGDYAFGSFSIIKK